MIEYMVMLRMRAGEDDVMDVEYSGVAHIYAKDAADELLGAMAYIAGDQNFIDAHIEKVEV